MFRKVAEERTDPGQVLVGVCQTCKRPVEAYRREAETNARRQAAHGTRPGDHKEWGEVPFTGCPGCGATVYLTVRPVRRFRPRPTEVTAEQWQPGVRVAGAVSGPSGIRPDNTYLLGPDNRPLYLSPGDWVVTDAQGNRKVVKPDAFARDYEEVK